MYDEDAADAAAAAAAGLLPMAASRAASLASTKWTKSAILLLLNTAAAQNLSADVVIVDSGQQDVLDDLWRVIDASAACYGAYLSVGCCMGAWEDILAIRS